MFLNFKKMNLKNKLFILFLLVSILPIIIIGIISYYLFSYSIYDKVKENLTNQVKYYKTLITDDYTKIEKDTVTLKDNCRTIVEQQAKVLFKMIALAKNQDEEKLKNMIASIVIGKTGYIYILSYDGKYIVSKNRERDGEDIINSQDANGRYFIQDIIKKGRMLVGESIDFDVYPWRNVGETEVFEKIAAVIHYPSKKWIIGVSAYYKDLLDIEIEKKEINEFKNKILKEKVGLTGYMYVMNSKGDLIFHPEKEGENIYNYDFTKEICKQKEGYIDYKWEGKKKVVAYSYFEKNDWIIASGSYFSDFTGKSRIILFSIIIVIVASLMISIFIVFFFTKSTIIPLIKIADVLNNSSNQIASASIQLSNSSQEIASGATEQASSIEETSSSMEELATMVKQNVGNAQETCNLAVKATDGAENGYVQMEKMLESMIEINKSSDQINKIIKVIDDIAFQTNILALNAAVEAARAGESGMGFAVVADEVKNLANRSAEAAKETAEMIEGSIKRTEAGVDIATKLAEIFKEILQTVKKVTEMAKEVETASIQQDSGINQVNKAIIQFDEVVQANASSAEETASSAEELNAQAEMLSEVVGRLNLLLTGKQRDKQEQIYIEQHKEKNMRTGKKMINNNQTQKDTNKKKKVIISPEKIIPFDEDEEFIEIE